MSLAPSKKFHLPWHQHEYYWISLYPRNADFSAGLLAVLERMGLKRFSDGAMAVKAPRDWKAVWSNLCSELENIHELSEVEIAISPGAEKPWQGLVHKQTPEEISVLADSLWLGDALLEGRIMCYLQPVVCARDQVFGYESFARAQAPDGSIISADKIISAARALGIEHMIDRHLQVQAIKTFVSSAFNGFLFVNFLPGFIQRPDIYLEGLSETVKTYNVIAKHIVLDFTKSETPRDMSHLKNVCDYARSCGYSIALDDIESVERARDLISNVKPDFVKIDMSLVHAIADPNKRKTIRDIIELARASGCAAIGEGVETEEIYDALKTLGLELFQGYLFSPPVPVEAAMKKSAV